ncbi:MAG: 2-amino-4-hydroxy-6-hydroxymethyldihydropteridine diphosphokinase [Muribaculaceae bacterium]|nr:2-amino-4-hydroxy-6-hydroxymethyldihydropteridine diphosphokinase [Muribaculaceae bacterium]
MRIHLNIGSNSGDRHAHLEQAVTALTSAFDGCTLTRSDIIETEPWGFESDHPFLNLGVTIESPQPMRLTDILARTQTAEKSVGTSPHRDSAGRYVDRTIDIDIIGVDSLVTCLPGLYVPHPRAHLRDFVLIPLIQTAPEWIHPLLHLTPAEILYGK